MASSVSIAGFDLSRRVHGELRVTPEATVSGFIDLHAAAARRLRASLSTSTSRRSRPVRCMPGRTSSRQAGRVVKGKVTTTLDTVFERRRTPSPARPLARY